jgi:hypothetical protein
MVASRPKATFWFSSCPPDKSAGLIPHIMPWQHARGFIIRQPCLLTLCELKCCQWRAPNLEKTNKITLILLLLSCCLFLFVVSIPIPQLGNLQDIFVICHWTFCKVQTSITCFRPETFSCSCLPSDTNIRVRGFRQLSRYMFRSYNQYFRLKIGVRPKHVAAKRNNLVYK